MIRTGATKSFKIPASMELEMNKKIVSDGYGLRGKSKWISDVLCKFLMCGDDAFVLDCIGYSEELERLDKTVSVRLSPMAESSLNEWVVKSRMQMPTLEGVKSKIIRTAIIHGLLGSSDIISQKNAVALP